MMSSMSIVALNEQTAAKAAKKNKRPFVPTPQAVRDRIFPKQIPNLGYYDPPGWEETDTTWFVDKTGMDDRGPALSVDRFLDVFCEYAAEHPDHGYGITEEGEFQCYITAFRPT